MEDSLDTNSVVGFVPRVFDYEEPNFVENRSKFRNDPNKMKEIRKAAAEKSKKAVGKSSRLSKKDDSGHPRLPKGQLFKCLLMLEIEQDNPDEIHVYMQEITLKFTIIEYAIISDLKYSGNIEEHLFSVTSKSALMMKYFSGSKGSVKRSLFIERFKMGNFENNSDVLNMSIIYFIHTFLYSQVCDSTISKSNFVMVENGSYEQFPWEKSSFEKLIALWRHDFFVAQQLYSMGGMPHVLNVWMYECCSEVDSTIAKRVGNVIPQIFNWQVVGIKVRYEKFMVEIAVDCSDKRPAIDVQSQVDLDIQGFEEFSTVPPIEILKKTGSERIHAEKTTLSSSLKSVCQNNSDEKWDDIKLFLQSYIFNETDKSTDVYSADDPMNGHYFDWNRSPIQQQSQDVEGCSEDNATASLDALVESVVNYNSDNTNVGTSTTVHVHNDHMVDYSSTLSESDQVELDGILKVIAAPVDDVPIEVVPSAGPIVNQHDISDCQLSLDFSDAVVAAHQAAKTPAKHIDVIFYHLRKKSKLRSDQDYRFTTTNYFFKNYIDKTYSIYYEDDTDTVLTTQQDYVEYVHVVLIEEAITHIIKGYCMPSGLPWHQVDEVYVPINCNENFHWVLAVIALKDKRIRVYDSLSRRRSTKSITEIQKLAKMLPTYLSDNNFYDETSRTDWPNLETYRDKITQTIQILNEHTFDVEYVQHIMQKESDSVYDRDCGVFVVGYAEYLSEEMNVPSDGFEALYRRMRYAILL
ncbi:hypothetical protein FXO37_18889 [Capsicum annuum]|nr:hypothetical protein FXO37_18889 [Capsicum annuum]